MIVNEEEMKVDPVPLLVIIPVLDPQAVTVAASASVQMAGRPHQEDVKRADEPVDNDYGIVENDMPVDTVDEILI